ncbi:MAG: bifunctional demethylmenaquinone methyltransferase/2-methoxy-6-polyprenyl-1,4-benzoquinol methylase UbiE [Phycisphaerae bacterium]|nr:bifunctional demethylmenaquinone methyltransferase/2-methoxy-6-polyprenyl-1,4-benzoquinol methylase UbiE [Phycisphaerae bacterium]
MRGVCKDDGQIESPRGCESRDDLLWDRERLTDPHHQPDKADRVRGMFDAIAPTYQLINTLASFGRDASWRRQAVALAATTSQDRVLDVACGTGDLAQAFRQRAGRVVGVDFAERMLALAAAHAPRRQNRPPAIWCRADALRLPFADGTFTMTCCAFGVRNFQDLDVGFREMYRVLRPGGRAVIVEFSMPENRLLRWLYGFYFERMMPRLATLVSRDRTGAYRYLARSVVAFVGRGEMVDRLRRAGFTGVACRPLTLGVVLVYVAEKGS